MKTITVAEFAGLVRRRPALYFASTTTWGLVNMILYVIQEAQRRFDKDHQEIAAIDITVYSDNSVRFQDSSNMLEFDDLNPSDDTDITTLIFSPLMFRAVLAVSEWAIVESYKGGKGYHQEFYKGETTKVLQVTSTSSFTTVHFLPDPLIFQEVAPSLDKIKEFFYPLTASTPHLQLSFTDLRTNEHAVFYYPNGLADYSKEVFGIEPIRIYGEKGNDRIDVAFGLAEEKAGAWGYVNGEIYTRWGTHVKGLEEGIMKVVRTYAREQGWAIATKRPTVSDLRKKLLSLVSIWIDDAHYSDSMKRELDTPRAKALVQRLITKELPKQFDENPALAKVIIDALYGIE